MKFRTPRSAHVLRAIVFIIAILPFCTTCTRNAPKPLPFTLLFTNEVRGYLEACG